MRLPGRALRGAPVPFTPRGARRLFAVSETPPILWEPDAARIERATITHYARWLADAGGVRTEGYDALWRWSVAELEAFWNRSGSSSACGLAALRRVVDSRRDAGGALVRRRPPQLAASTRSAMPGPRHGRLRPRLGAPSPRRAVVARARGRGDARTAAALAPRAYARATGSSAYVPNISRRSSRSSRAPASAPSGRAARPTSAWRACSTGSAQIDPRVLIAVDGYRYGGSDLERLAVVHELRQACRRSSGGGTRYLDAVPRLDRLEQATGWNDS